MSQAIVVDFINAARSNPALLNQINNAGQGRSESEAGEFVAALGREAGYSFSADDALAFRENALAMLAGSSVEGDDSVLEGVSGGNGLASLNAIQALFGLPPVNVPPPPGPPQNLGTGSSDPFSQMENLVNQLNNEATSSNTLNDVDQLQSIVDQLEDSMSSFTNMHQSFALHGW